MQEKLRVGIVGCGGVARQHVTAYRDAGDADVAGVFDVDRDAAAAMARETGAEPAASLDQMASDGRLDGVSICTPPAAHTETCRPFLDAGIPVLCEKPLEVNGDRAERLAEVVRRSGCLFMTGFCHRFYPPIAELKKLVERGELGRSILFRNIFAGGVLPLQTNHRRDPAVSGGGCLVDHCSHSVDLFRFLVAEPTHVQAFAGNVMQDVPIEDFGMIHLRCGTTAFGEITASYSVPVSESTVEWYGTEGTAVVNYSDPSRPALSYRKEGGALQSVECPPPLERFPWQIRHFLDCVRTKSPPSISADDGVRAARIADAIYASVADGQCVEVPRGEEDDAGD